jgi:hypothetical protein
MASQHRLTDAEHVLEALEEHGFGLAHLLFAIPQQLDVEIHHPVFRWQAPEQTLLDIPAHQMGRQGADAVTRADQAVNFFEMVEEATILPVKPC